jgi:acetylornithine deacetylase/succinyl-diaminopimelate desuccinylase-like protein
MLNAHVETVGSADMLTPFSATLRDGRLYGWGACHVKGSLAACMAAVKVLVDAGASLAGDVLVAAVADEEWYSLGTAEVIKQYQVGEAIATEPTRLDIHIAHKGFMHLEADPKLAVVQVLQQAATEVLGKQARLVGRSGWTDTALLAAAGVETVAMGPIGAGAHS